MLLLDSLTHEQQQALLRAGTPCRSCGSNHATLQAALENGRSVVRVFCTRCGHVNLERTMKPDET